MRGLLGTAIGCALLTGLPAGARLSSPRADIYDMSAVDGGWFRSEEAAAQGRDLWILPGSGSLAFFTQCEIRLSPTEWFTPAEFADYVMELPADEYRQLLSGSFGSVAAASDRREAQIDGAPAVRHTVDATMNGAAVTWLHVMMYRAGHIIMTACGSPSDKFEEARPDLDAFIDQIQFAPVD